MQTAYKPSDKKRDWENIADPVTLQLQERSRSYVEGAARVWHHYRVVDDDDPMDVLSAGSLIYILRTYIREKIARKMTAWHDY